ncbi:hypothetical protein JDV02_005591 [Purpureocillium takamizusanense]|uniref:Serine hydrolase domain-containing protein n=1 Tax=Purpureocillium takamizusanense TaxID=2060973 RepID=A0A9Q8QHM2_9HYPO|nr:uncharacterized protein JDV02_005591 [Purpureocillium takamizusanense]UNI19407.1 hypothetical protein JDV02_005591 [Purpureocillium takamizusanense]
MVIGFSLGAALAATMLLRPGQLGQAPVKSLVFLSGTLPADWQELQGGTTRFMQAIDVKTVIQIPSVHAWDDGDVEHPGEAEQLLLMCGKKSRRVVRHSAGHGIPSRGSEVAAIASAIKDMVAELA